MKNTQYQLKRGDSWITCKKAQPTQKGGGGFLYYELSDGTSGLSRRGTWRARPHGTPEDAAAVRKATISDDLATFALVENSNG
jgi:hypothetical protein